MCKTDHQNWKFVLQTLQFQLPETWPFYLHSLLLHESKHDARIHGMENRKISMATLLFLVEKFTATYISHVHTELLYTGTVFIL